MIEILKNRKNLFLFFAITMTTAILAFSIVYVNVYLILIVVGAFAVFLVLRSNMFSFLVIFVVAFFGASLEDYGFLLPQINWLNEFIFLLLFLKAITLKLWRREKICLKFKGVFFALILVGVISCLLNESSIMHALLFFRLLLRFYILFLAIINLDLDEKFMLAVNKVLIFLFIIQIPTAFIKLTIYGQGESAIGTYDTHGGGVSAVLPLIAISFLIAFYFYYKPSLIYPILSLGFIAFGLVGGKRALIIYTPVVVMFFIIFMKEQFKKTVVYVAVAAVVIILTGYLSIKFLPTLNPQRTIGGEVDLSYTRDFLYGYTMQRYEGRSAGRLSTTITVFQILEEEGWRGLLFGLGPGSYIKTRFESLKTTLRETEALPIEYGVPGLSWLALQVGYTGSFIYLFLFFLILIQAARYFRSENRPYWKSFGLGVVGFSFVMLIKSISYWAVFIDDLLPLIYFMLAGFTIRLKMAKDAEKTQGNTE
ncbi:MAG: hypothetical protein JSV17_14970 [Candidatus Aminicenantes bacterium]|nr:MAG: hypothetical protein JSV17_14970 [Candidatus Aminicenantes bacterium]